jgi:hypothetical protein
VELCAVTLPRDFVDHALAQHRALSVAGVMPNRNGLMFDNGAVVPVPPSTAAMLREASTLSL